MRPLPSSPRGPRVGRDHPPHCTDKNAEARRGPGGLPTATWPAAQNQPVPLKLKLFPINLSKQNLVSVYCQVIHQEVAIKRKSCSLSALTFRGSPGPSAPRTAPIPAFPAAPGTGRGAWPAGGGRRAVERARPRLLNPPTQREHGTENARARGRAWLRPNETLSQQTRGSWRAHRPGSAHDPWSGVEWQGQDRKPSRTPPTPTGQVAVSPAGLPAFLNPPLGGPRGQGLPGRRQGVDFTSELCLRGGSPRGKVKGRPGHSGKGQVHLRGPGTRALRSDPAHPTARGESRSPTDNGPAGAHAGHSAGSRVQGPRSALRRVPGEKAEGRGYLRGLGDSSIGRAQT